MTAAWDKTRDEFVARFPKLGPLMDDDHMMSDVKEYPTSTVKASE